MADFKLYGKCFACKKGKFFVRKRAVPIPTGQIATSRELFCTPCFKGLLSKFK